MEIPIKVSVIIPCYNAEKFIKRSLDSLEQQTYKGTLEIICINDGSTDNTLTVLNQYKAGSRLNIKILSGKNCGVSTARNMGIDCAKGTYIAFLDADDMYKNIFLETLIKAIEDMNADTAYGYWSHRSNDLQKKGDLIYRVNQHEMMQHFMYRKKPLSFFNFLYRKEILDKYGIRFDKKLNYGEDNLFFWKYLCHIHTGVYCEAPMYWYYQNKDSAMHNPNWNIVQGVTAIMMAETYLEKQKFIYIEEFHDYLPARSKFAVAKEFARYGQKENYYRFYKKYHLYDSIGSLYGKNGVILTICAYLLKRFPAIFYNIARIFLK